MTRGRCCSGTTLAARRAPGEAAASAARSGLLLHVCWALTSILPSLLPLPTWTRPSLSLLGSARPGGCQLKPWDILLLQLLLFEVAVSNFFHHLQSQEGQEHPPTLLLAAQVRDSSACWLNETEKRSVLEQNLHLELFYCLFHLEKNPD